MSYDFSPCTGTSSKQVYYFSIPAPFVTVNRRTHSSLPSLTVLFSENSTTALAELSIYLPLLTGETAILRNKNFTCPYILTCKCQKTCSTKMELQSHLQLEHKTKRKHQCLFCGAKFARVNAKKCHEIAAHANIRQFQCSHPISLFAK